MLPCVPDLVGNNLIIEDREHPVRQRWCFGLVSWSSHVRRSTKTHETALTVLARFRLNSWNDPGLKLAGDPGAGQGPPTFKAPES